MSAATMERVELSAVECAPGCPIPSLGLMAAHDAGKRRPLLAGVDCNGRVLRARTGPHPSALWIGEALRDLCRPGGPIDQSDWCADHFDVGEQTWSSRPGGTYYVHEVGEDPDVWLAASKDQMVAWLAERGYDKPAKEAKDGRRVKVGKRGKGVKVREVDPVDVEPAAPAPSPVGEGTRPEPEPDPVELAASVARHPAGWPRQVIVDELERREAKRAAIKAGASKREALEQFPPPTDRALLAVGTTELRAMVAA